MTPGLRSLAVALLAVPALLTAACSSGGSQPLTDLEIQEGQQICVPAPFAGNATPAWNSPVGFAINSYYNSSSAPVVVESVTLIDPHNVTLNQAVVYAATGERHQLITSNGWPGINGNSDPAWWARRQHVPGAVIGLDAANPGLTHHNAYEVVLDISATSRAGGYAIGQQVTYKQGSDQYTIRSYEGYAISPPGAEGGRRCGPLTNAISAAWPNHSS